jgi:hypothetical protein
MWSNLIHYGRELGRLKASRALKESQDLPEEKQTTLGDFECR